MKLEVISHFLLYFNSFSCKIYINMQFEDCPFTGHIQQHHIRMICNYNVVRITTTSSSSSQYIRIEIDGILSSVYMCVRWFCAQLIVHQLNTYHIHHLPYKFNCCTWCIYVYMTHTLEHTHIKALFAPVHSTIIYLNKYMGIYYINTTMMGGTALIWLLLCSRVHRTFEVKCFLIHLKLNWTSFSLLHTWTDWTTTRRANDNVEWTANLYYTCHAAHNSKSQQTVAIKWQIKSFVWYFMYTQQYFIRRKQNVFWWTATGCNHIHTKTVSVWLSVGFTRILERERAWKNKCPLPHANTNKWLSISEICKIICVQCALYYI